MSCLIVRIKSILSLLSGWLSASLHWYWSHSHTAVWLPSVPAPMLSIEGCGFTVYTITESLFPSDFLCLAPLRSLSMHRMSLRNQPRGSISEKYIKPAILMVKQERRVSEEGLHVGKTLNMIPDTVTSTAIIHTIELWRKQATKIHLKFSPLVSYGSKLKLDKKSSSRQTLMIRQSLKVVKSNRTDICIYKSRLMVKILKSVRDSFRRLRFVLTQVCMSISFCLCLQMKLKIWLVLSMHVSWENKHDRARIFILHWHTSPPDHVKLLKTPQKALVLVYY